MQTLDWIILSLTIIIIVVYGIWKSRGSRNIENYLKGEKSLPWYTISLSVIATQASAVTFLSVPGQAYVDGMRFVLFYLGLPLAMIVISAVIVPVYYRLRVFTAYEYLESRFDLKTRVLTAFFFLIQRGLAAGVSIAAPAIVLSVILGWNITYINLFIGGLVIVYTVTGGSKAVSQTQKLQMITILTGMGIAGYLVVQMMPQDVNFGDALFLAGQTGKFNTMDFSFDLDNKYTLWTGLLGGFFLQMAYFGTDQSQVGRYLGGTSLSQIRLGLLFNGIFKIPMQFFILFIGAMLFVFYQFQQPPIIFNNSELDKIHNSKYAEKFHTLEQKHQEVFVAKKAKAKALVEARHHADTKKIQEAKQAFQEADIKAKALRGEVAEMLQEIDKQDTQKLVKLSEEERLEQNTNYINSKDSNYIFLTFVTNFLPAGLVGLLIAVILSASMSTTASELSALASTTLIDMYKRMIYTQGSQKHYLRMSKVLIVFWGILAIIFAQLASHLGTLIEAVNILGSLFYGTVLGVFLLALFFKKVASNATFYAAIIGEVLVILIYLQVFGFKVAYLWLNMIGCLLVIILAFIFTLLLKTQKPKTHEL